MQHKEREWQYSLLRIIQYFLLMFVLMALWCNLLVPFSNKFSLEA
jgi:hypothetical protein